ncbi:hypothetical protein ACROYT_G033535, partial [Oculina patagonica]
SSKLSTATLYSCSTETMENVKSESAPTSATERARKQVRWWMFLAIAACIVAAMTTSVLIWCTTTRTAVNQNCPNKTSVDDKPSEENGSLTSPCPRLPTIRPLPIPLPSELADVLNHLDSILTEMVDKNTSLPAISANILYRDSVLWGGHRGSKLYPTGDNTKPDGDTVYRIGSVTKIFPVLLVYKLYEDGMIGSIDDPLSKYVPEFSIRNPFSRDNITLRQIASQMSGLPREAPCIYHCKGTNSTEQLSLLRNRSLVLPPWKMPSYSNLGYALLGRLLTEKMLNTTFENWTQMEILDPLEMKNTGFEITPRVEKKLAFPYRKNGKRMPFSNIGWANPSGGMYSTINDLTKLGMMFTRPSNQRVFRPSTLREMALPVDIAPDGRTLWGSPFEMMFSNGFLVRRKGGNIDSYAAYFSFVPQLELGINILISAASFVKSSVKTADTFSQKAYDKLLPVLNKTLFKMDESADFPISSKAFTGLYHVHQTNAVTLAKSRYNATIVKSKSVLLFKGQSEESFPFTIRYIGDSLTFQAEYVAAGMSCFFERAGIFADLFFSRPRKGGLSHRFTVPQWSIVARRINTAKEAT